MTYAAYPSQQNFNNSTPPPWQGLAPQGPLGTASFPLPPQGQTPPQFPGPQRRKPVVLVVLLVAMVLAAGTFGTLYFTTLSDKNTTAEALSGKEKELGETAGELKETKEDLKKAKGRAQSAEEDLSDAQDDVDALEACRTASQDLLYLLSTGNASDPTIQQQLTEALNEVTLACV